MQDSKDIIIIGGGIAGLTAAYLLSKKFSISIIDSGDGILKMSSTQMAQAGIAASKNWEKHVDDTLKAGEFKNKEKSVEVLCRDAMSAVNFLKEEIGVSFLEEQSLEGGHSERRVFTTGDDTGFQIYKKLFEKCKEQKNISWIHKARVLRILKGGEGDICAVMYKECNTEPVEVCIDSRSDKKRESHKMDSRLRGNDKAGSLEGGRFISGKKIILATGGIGGLFEYSTNPLNLKGDGLLLAYEAGAELEDLLNIQFHPTGLKHKSRPMFLLSEAMRGEGAYLLNEKHERFLDHLTQKELSPRNIVVNEMMKQKEVFMDLRHKPQKFWVKHFPHICKNLKHLGYDITKDLLPITPVQHFLCGGIKTNLNAETSVKNLFAVGECASTGVHGTNRLASNSLTEGVVFGLSCAEYIISSGRFKVQSAKFQSCSLTGHTEPVEVCRGSTFHYEEEVIADDEAIQILNSATEEDLQSIRRSVQKYLGPGKNNISALKKVVEKLPHSFEKRIVSLFFL